MTHGCGHLHVSRGKRVIVHLRDGSKIEARFKEHRDRMLLFVDHPPVATKLVRTISIAKG